jgi:hypothetical protein
LSRDPDPESGSRKQLLNEKNTFRMLPIAFKFLADFSLQGRSLSKKANHEEFFSEHFYKFIKGTLKDLSREIVPLRRMNLPSKESDD